MGDLPRPLGDPQDQVPVLGALELGVEAADLLDQGASQHAEVAGVHLGPEPLRRPVGLEERPGVATRARRSCLRRCRRSRPRDLRAAPPSTSSSASGWSMSSWSRRTTNSPPRHRQRVVGGGDDAAVFARGGDPDAVVAARGASRISRTCGCSEQSSTRQSSQSPKRWRRTESQHRPQDVGRRFVDRRDDREAGRGQAAQPRPRRRCESRRATRPGSFSG